MPERELAAIVVAYHGVDALGECLAPICDDVPIVVIDNSSDAAIATVARGCGADYIDMGSNRGFAAGVNMGLSRLPSDADVLLLNPDAVIAPDIARQLHSALYSDPSLAAVAPALAGPQGPQRVMWPFPSPARMWREALGLAQVCPPPDEFAVGAVLILRREAINEIGGFDERFFLYAEETDWQYRAANRGWRSCMLPDVIAAHAGAGSSVDSLRREALFHSGTETYIRKVYGKSGWASYRLAAMVGASVRALLAPAGARRAARRRLALYLHGPRRVAGHDG